MGEGASSVFSIYAGNMSYLTTTRRFTYRLLFYFILNRMWEQPPPPPLPPLLPRSLDAFGIPRIGRIFGFLL